MKGRALKSSPDWERMKSVSVPFVPGQLEAGGSSRAGVQGPRGRDLLSPDLGTDSARPGRSSAQVGTLIPSRAPHYVL